MLHHALRVLNQIETRLSQIILRQFFPPELCVVSGGLPNHSNSNVYEPEKDFGILWAVPKSRRTIEKKRMRKYGWPDDVWKPLVAKKNLIPCTACGNSHEAGYLCRKCT